LNWLVLITRDQGSGGRTARGRSDSSNPPALE
jgi:hypothetical protein